MEHSSVSQHNRGGSHFRELKFLDLEFVSDFEFRISNLSVFWSMDDAAKPKMSRNMIKKAILKPKSEQK
jgi:hypothetical protein